MIARPRPESERAAESHLVVRQSTPPPAKAKMALHESLRGSPWLRWTGGGECHPGGYGMSYTAPTGEGVWRSSTCSALDCGMGPYRADEQPVGSS